MLIGGSMRTEDASITVSNRKRMLGFYKTDIIVTTMPNGSGRTLVKLGGNTSPVLRVLMQAKLRVCDND